MPRPERERIWLDVHGHPVRTKPLWTIYLITDPAGEKYVGCTSRKLERRWRDHIGGYITSGPLHRAMREHGVDRFSLQIIGEAITVEEARRKEAAAMRAYGTIWPNGYNMRSYSGLRTHLAHATR